MTAHVPAIPNFLPIGPVLFGMFLGWRSHRAAVCPALGVFLLVYFTISAITGRSIATVAKNLRSLYPVMTLNLPMLTWKKSGNSSRNRHFMFTAVLDLKIN